MRGGSALGIQGEGSEPVEQSVCTATRDSMRARCMPRHTCTPNPKPTCWRWVAEHVVAVGVVVLALVSVGRPDQERHVGALLDGHARQLGGTHGPAQDHGHRRLPAHGLLEGLGVEGAVGVERLELRPVAEQCEQQAARGAVGGLHPRRQQEAQEGVDLLVAQPLAVDLGPDQIADEVVTWRGPALGSSTAAKYSCRAADAARPRSQLAATLVSSSAQRWNLRVVRIGAVRGCGRSPAPGS